MVGWRHQKPTMNTKLAFKNVWVYLVNGKPFLTLRDLRQKVFENDDKKTLFNLFCCIFFVCKLPVDLTYSSCHILIFSWAYILNYHTRKTSLAPCTYIVSLVLRKRARTSILSTLKRCWHYMSSLYTLKNGFGIYFKIYKKERTFMSSST